MIRPIMKELSLEPFTEDLSVAAEFLDNLDFTKVKTKYTKGKDWTAISLYGYGPKITDILKPGVLKSSVKIDEKLQWTNLHEATPLNPVFKILENLPCKYERVRFMKLEAGKIIGMYNGRTEFGARALGNRSILARPDLSNTVKKINEAVKNRDFWMPFAISILKKHHKKYLFSLFG